MCYGKKGSVKPKMHHKPSKVIRLYRIKSSESPWTAANRAIYIHIEPSSL